jgi:hypothetical protein
MVAMTSVATAQGSAKLVVSSYFCHRVIEGCLVFSLWGVLFLF